MPIFGYLAVEGPHDVEFVCRLLKPYGFDRVKSKSKLNEFFHGLIPKDFPHNDDLLKRVPVPLFVENDTHLIAIDTAIGDSKVVNSLLDTIAFLGQNTLTGAGILMDADSVDLPQKRFQLVQSDLNVGGVNITVSAGEVEVINNTVMGVYILPDNNVSGTLECILLECAQQNFPTILADANSYIGSVAPKITKNLSKDFNKPAGKKKAIVGAIANVLKPGKSVQVSIQDNDWLNGAAMNIASVKAAQDFLKRLFSLP